MKENMQISVFVMRNYSKCNKEQMINEVMMKYNIFYDDAVELVDIAYKSISLI